MSKLFDSWSDEQIGSLITYMMNSDVSPDEYTGLTDLQDELLDEAVERGLIQE